MEPSTFRRDPWLRSSAYHLATWSLAAFVVEMRLRMSSDIDSASATAAVGVLLGGSVMTSLTHERRLGKMLGPAGDPVWAGAGRMWLLLLAGLVAGSVVLAAGSLGGLLYPLWCLAIGAGFGAWGLKIGLQWYAGVGLALAGAGLLDLGLGVMAGPAEPLRILVLGLALPIFALLTNRRFVWGRESA